MTFLHNIPEEISNRIIFSIFDNTGLIYSDSRISYFEHESEVLQNFGHVGGKYLQDKLLPTLKEKIFLPSQSNHIIPPDWKNNNCESMNHKFKLLGDWKVSKIPDLIDRIRDIHESHRIEIRGNFELSDRAKHLSVMHDLWVDLIEERRKVHSKCLRFCPCVGALESTDRQLTVPVTTRQAKKNWPDKAGKKL